MRRKLGELLVEAGAVTSDDVDAVLADQSAGEPSRLGDLLLSTGKITPAALARALATQYGLPFSDLSSVAPEASALVPLEFQRAHKLTPFRVDFEGVHVALADPTLSEVVDELRSQLKREVVVYVAAIDAIEGVHAAQAADGVGEPVVMGEVLEEESSVPEKHKTAEIPFPALEEELFGSLDLGVPSEMAPLSTDLADEIGRHDLEPAQDFSGFSSLATSKLPPVAEPEVLLDAVIEPLLDAEVSVVPAPLISPILDLGPDSSEPTQKFDPPLAEPEPEPEVAPIPSFAIPPEAPIEPRKSAPGALARPATLGRIALRRVAVNREGVAVAVAPAPSPAPVAPKPQPAELQLPDWMRSSTDVAPVIPLLAPVAVDPTLTALLARVESGDLPAGPVLAALLRLLVERRVVESAALSAELEKL